LFNKIFSFSWTCLVICVMTLVLSSLILSLF
jgi:hypothetical protein